MVRTGLADPDLDQQSTTNESFQRTHSLLCRWQEQLEFFLYHLCRVVAPALAEEFHWSCSEAAELSQLSEKVTEYFCFRHKKLFRARDISDCERESFCSDLHTIRQIRHCAVHRVVVNATTIAKYARSAQNVLAILKRLGGTEFQNVYGGQLEQFLQSFWDVRSPHLRQLAPAQPRLKQRSDDRIENYSLLEGKAANIRRMQRLQNAAMEKRLDNIANMAEDIENSLIQKAARRAKLSQQIEDAQKGKTERAQRSQQERYEADQRRNERTKRSQQERDDADRRRNERTKRSQQERDEADRRRNERTKRSQQERDEADRRRNERARSQQETKMSKNKLEPPR